MKRILSLILPALACAVLLLALPAHAEDGVIIDAQTFPDPVFRQWLLDGANLNGMGADGVFTPEELAQITQISVPSLGISSLEGIELFPELTTLSCSNNLLTQLDVSRNAKLVTLLCASTG